MHGTHCDVSFAVEMLSLPARRKKHGGKRPCSSQDVNRRESFQSDVSAQRRQRSGGRGRNGERRQRREVWREERDERGKSQ